MSDADRAGIEAALEASGLLTGLLRDADSPRHPESGEVLFVPQPISTGETSLLTLLHVELPAGSTLPESQVEAVLGSIRVAGNPDDPAPVWLSASGHFRVGAARGAWSKSAAEFVGESVRADARARELETARV